MTKNVRENDRIKNKYPKYTPPEYVYFFINRKTSDDVLDDLIQCTTFVKNYTIDTEDQARYRQPSIPALIQVQLVHDKYPPMILLIEMMHLPAENSTKFLKMKQLLGNILSSNHVISCWGNPVQELQEFIRYSLFDDTHIHQIIPKNVQHDFTNWFNQLHPNLYRSKWSLQSAVEHALQQWLDKRMTMANWGCGIDPSLETFTPTHAYGKEKEKIIRDEKEYRELMIDYSILDCTSVTELQALIPANKIGTSNRPEDIVEEEKQISFEDMEIDIDLHPTDNHEVEPTIQGNFPGPEDVEQQNQVLVQTPGGADNLEELLSSNEVGFVNESPSDRAGNHVPNADHPRTEEPDVIDPAPLTRCQKKRKKQRENRYKYPVFRNLYYRCNTTQVKNILVDLNIRWTNVDVKHHRLKLGLHDRQTQRRIDELLHQDMFTEKHYYRIHRRHHPRHRY